MNMKDSILLKHVSLTSYIVGFFISIVLTLFSFGLVKIHLHLGSNSATQNLIIFVVLLFAFMQLAVQLIFFLHLVHESKPRWNLMFFVSTFALILVVVVASVWIMNNLNYNMMPDSVSQFIIRDEGINPNATNY